MPISRKLRNNPAAKGPLLYYITDRRQLSGVSLLSCIRKALNWGVDFIQVREKDLSDRALFDLTNRIVDLSRDTGCRILVNGRADIAVAAGAHGVHLPSMGLQAVDIRPWVPKGFCIGTSVHSMREIRRAEAQGVDYILAGHVFPTPSKSGYGEPLGLNFLSKACHSTKTPILGLGGVKAELVASALEAGAAGIAGIRIFQDAGEFSRLKKLARASDPFGMGV